jgi:hypothetical protein
VFGTALLSVKIGVSASGPAPPAPTLKAKPATGLRDSQLVRVTGRGFARGEQLVLSMQCVAGATTSDQCEAATIQPATLDNEGTMATTVAVRRDIVVGDKTIDCATSKCEIVSFVEGLLFGGEMVPFRAAWGR